MATLAIKGHATRGKEIIEILEMLGGHNHSHNFLGKTEYNYYYIGDYDIISCIPKEEIDSSFVTFTIEEFLKKYPYKVGDKVIYTAGIGFISKATWDDEDNEILYEVKVGNTSWLTDAKHLQPYKEETIEDNIVDTVKESDDRYRIVLNHQFDMEVDEGEYYAVRRPELSSNIWHDIDEEPIYENGVTPLIIDSNYGHISQEGHCYDQVQWKHHIESQKHREFKWAYEKDLMNMNL